MRGEKEAIRGKTEIEKGDGEREGESHSRLLYWQMLFHYCLVLRLKSGYISASEPSTKENIWEKTNIHEIDKFRTQKASLYIKCS